MVTVVYGHWHSSITSLPTLLYVNIVVPLFPHLPYKIIMSLSLFFSLYILLIPCISGKKTNTDTVLPFTFYKQERWNLRIMGSRRPFKVKKKKVYTVRSLYMVQALHWSFSQTGHNLLENHRHHLDYMIFKYRKQNYSLFQVVFSHIAEGDLWQSKKQFYWV